MSTMKKQRRNITGLRNEIGASQETSHVEETDGNCSTKAAVTPLRLSKPVIFMSNQLTTKFGTHTVHIHSFIQ